MNKKLEKIKDELTSELITDGYAAGIAFGFSRAVEVMKPLIGALKGLRYHGDSCWCEVAIGNPNFGGKHTQGCLDAREALKEIGEE